MISSNSDDDVPPNKTAHLACAFFIAKMLDKNHFCFSKNVTKFGNIKNNSGENSFVLTAQDSGEKRIPR